MSSENSNDDVNHHDHDEAELMIGGGDGDDDDDFSKEMRKVTRKIHNLSDALVNAKLGIAMSDDRIWAEGLLVFYEIFKFLECTMETSEVDGIDYLTRFRDLLLLTTNTNNGRQQQLLGRTEAFEKDIQFYYGSNYLNKSPSSSPSPSPSSSSYVIRPSVSAYLAHLEGLKRDDPVRLLAYIYHLYMGLFSGGQILKKKRQLGEKIKSRARNILGLGQYFFPTPPTQPPADSLNGCNGNEVVNFEHFLSSSDSDGNGGGGRSLYEIKKEMRATMNAIASRLSDREREAILDESILVFKNNNSIVHSIKNVNSTAFRNIITNPYVIVLLINVSAILFFILK